MTPNIADTPGERTVIDRRTVYEGMVWNIGRDTIDFAPGVRFDREYIAHTGAVAVLAVDSSERIIMIRQYRHPAKHTMWEIPAGLLDHEGEDPADAALRELAEETGYRARICEPLIEFYPSPGGSNERIKVFVARDVTRDPDVGFTREAEESEIEVRAVPWDDALAAALSGSLLNGTTVSAILTYALTRRS